jgi:hypothetical protein
MGFPIWLFANSQRWLVFRILTVLLHLLQVVFIVIQFPEAHLGAATDIPWHTTFR